MVAMSLRMRLVATVRALVAMVVLGTPKPIGDLATRRRRKDERQMRLVALSPGSVSRAPPKNDKNAGLGSAARSQRSNSGEKPKPAASSWRRLIGRSVDSSG